LQIWLQQPLEALQWWLFLHFADVERFEEAARDSLTPPMVVASLSAK
jgi:hypothetical protein